MAEIVLDEVTKDLHDGAGAVECIPLTTARPSGCGKTTRLRSIAGLETITSSRVVIGERDVRRTAPDVPDLAMAQSYALYRQLGLGDLLDRRPAAALGRPRAGRLGLDFLSVTSGESPSRAGVPATAL